MNRNRCAEERLHAWCFLLAFTAISVMALAIGCRSKDTPTGPNDNPEPGPWRLYLDAPPSMFRNEPGGHVENDTITLRLFNPYGQVPADVLVVSQCDVSHDSVTRMASTRSDTINFSWGTYPPIVYWGTGGSDGREVVRSWAVSFTQGDTDTLALASASFKVFDPIDSTR